MALSTNSGFKEVLDDTDTKRFNMSALEKLSGVSAHSIRAWEKRYSIFAPERTRGGHRLYRQSDLEYLKVLSFLIGAGHSISSLATISRPELALMCREYQKKLGDSSAEIASPDQLVQLLLTHCFAFHEKELLSILDRALETHELSVFLIDVVATVFRRIGEITCSNELEFGQEHFFTSCLRSFLGNLLLKKNGAWKKSSKTMLFTTPANEWHEIGILISSILGADAGYFIRYLGPNLPEKNLVTVLNAQEVHFCILGCAFTNRDDFVQNTLKYVTFVDVHWNNPLGKIVLGGVSSLQLDKETPKSTLQHSLICCANFHNFLGLIS